MTNWSLGLSVDGVKWDEAVCRVVHLDYRKFGEKTYVCEKCMVEGFIQRPAVSGYKYFRIRDNTPGMHPHAPYLHP